MWWILAAVSAVTLCYWLLKRPHKYWIEKGVKQGSPKFIFGDGYEQMMQRQSFPELVEMVYNMCPNTR